MFDLKLVLRIKDKIGPSTDSNDQLVDDDLRMCEEFNSYFTSVLTVEDISKFNCYQKQWNYLMLIIRMHCLIYIYIIQDEVFKRIIKLHCNKASGVVS